MKLTVANNPPLIMRLIPIRPEPTTRRVDTVKTHKSRGPELGVCSVLEQKGLEPGNSHPPWSRSRPNGSVCTGTALDPEPWSAQRHSDLAVGAGRAGAGGRRLACADGRGETYPWRATEAPPPRRVAGGHDFCSENENLFSRPLNFQLASSA